MPGRHVGGGHHSSHHSHHHSHHSHHSHSHHRHSNHHHHHSGYGGGRSGCTGIISVMAIMMFVIPAIILIFEAVEPDNTYYAETVTSKQYEKIDTLPSVQNTEYVEDNINVITDEREVVKALRYFEQKTGICPVIITEKTLPDNNQYASDYEIEQYVVEQYEQRFDDEQHMIFYYFSDIDTQGVIWGETGNEADKYMDDAAWEILFDEVETYLLQDDYQKAFSTGFINAADKLSGN